MKESKKFIEKWKQKSQDLFKNLRKKTINHSNKLLVTTKLKKILKHIDKK
jgi:hypothetical protein